MSKNVYRKPNIPYICLYDEIEVKIYFKKKNQTHVCAQSTKIKVLKC